MRRVLILGDSIARGDGASRPELSFVAFWTATFGQGAERYYFCRGGATSATAREWAPYVWCEPSPEIVLVSYGMNDQTRARRRLGRRGGPTVPPGQYRENMRTAVEA